MDFKEFKEKCFGKSVEEIKEIIKKTNNFWNNEVDTVKLVVDAGILADTILHYDKDFKSLYVFKKKCQILLYILKNLTNIELVPEDEDFDDYNIFIEKAILESNSNAYFFKTVIEEVIKENEQNIINELYEVFKSKLPTIEDMKDLRASISDVFKDESPEQLKIIENILAYNDPIMKEIRDIVTDINIQEEIKNSIENKNVIEQA